MDGADRSLRIVPFEPSSHDHDRYLLCGYLPSEGLLGGRHPLSTQRAREAFAGIAAQTGDSVERVADASIAVATSTMQARILPFLARIGVEPSDLTLMIFGGAGGVHGPLLARELGVRQILVPRIPSVFCAYGCLVAELVHDAVRSIRGEAPDAGALHAAFGQLARQGADWIAAQGSAVDRVSHVAEMRYAAQSFTIPVELTQLVAGGADLKAVTAAFHDEHRRLFDHADPGAAVVVDELRTRSHGARPKPHGEPPQRGPMAAITPRRHRNLRLDGSVVANVPVYARDDLTAGWKGSGPAIIEQDVATVLVPPGFEVEVSPLGDLKLCDAITTE